MHEIAIVMAERPGVQNINITMQFINVTMTDIKKNDDNYA